MSTPLALMADSDEIFADISPWWPNDADGNERSVRSVTLAFKQHSGLDIPE